MTFETFDNGIDAFVAAGWTREEMLNTPCLKELCDELVWPTTGAEEVAEVGMPSAEDNDDEEEKFDNRKSLRENDERGRNGIYEK